MRSNAADRLRRLLLLPLALLGLLALPASAPPRQESAVTSIDILALDASAFPDVRLRARVLGADGQPRETLDASELIITENDAALPFRVAPVNAGISVALVADLGAGAAAPGASGLSRVDEVRELMARYIEGMGDQDSATVIQLNEAGLSVLQPITTNKGALRAAAAAVGAPAGGTQLTNGLSALDRAQADLLSTGGTTQSRAILFFSTGIQSTLPVGYEDVEQTALAEEIPIYPVLVNAADAAGGFGLERLAANTGGLYAWYTGSESVAPLLERLHRQRTQFVFDFRSESRASGERSVTLEVRGGGPEAARDFGTYAVEVLPPRVRVDAPVPGAEFHRRAASPTENLAEIPPTEIAVSAHVEWPDGHARRLQSAQLFVDNRPSGPLLDTAGESVRLAWDVSGIQTPGLTPVRVQVQVTDELGFTSVSEPLLVNVLVDVPAPQPQTPGCADITRPAERMLCYVNNVAGIAALILAVPALALAALAWFGRRELVRARQAARDRAEASAPPPDGDLPQAETGEVVVSSTQPLSDGRTAAAVLRVLRGAPELVGVQYPVYGGTVTPLGRDPGQVEVVFPGERHAPVSRRHCEIREVSGGFALRDLASTYGTFLNGERLQQMRDVPLHHGDEIALGPLERGGVLLRFESTASEDDLPGDVRDTQPRPLT